MAKQQSQQKKSQQKNTKKKGSKIAEFNFNFDIKTIFIVIFVSLFAFTIYSAFSQEFQDPANEKSLSAVVQDVKQENVERIVVNNTKLEIQYKDGEEAIAYKEPGESIITILNDSGVDPNNVKIQVNDTQGAATITNILINLIPAILLVAFFIFIFRQAKGAQDSVFSFGQSKAKRFSKDMPKVKFKDVAGVNEIKQELEEVVDFLKHPEKYKKLGARTPKGVILIGPAGCGKTLLAKAVAGEANVPFFSIAGSEFMEMLVGIGAARVRDLFATAKKNEPAILFIDEIDAIGRARSVGGMPGHDEREQTLNQILVEMDGFSPNERVVVIAATNRGDLLDPALMRPGRFDRRMIVDYPDVEGRKEIIKIHSNGKPFTDEVDWDQVAERTVGFSGADLENMLNEAAIYAARQEREKISPEDIEEAATKVKLGPEKKRLQSEYDKKLTAYHEAGHALVSHFQPHTDMVHRISIVSRGMALGYTLIPPGKDKLHETKTHLIERLSVMMGGRAAEDLVFNEVTTGAANDFNQATAVARAMVTEYGMSNLGPINFGPDSDITDYRRGWSENSISQEMQYKIDIEIQSILKHAYNEALSILKKKRTVLNDVSEALLKKENMSKEEFEKIVGKKENQNALDVSKKKKKPATKSEKKEEKK
jgi:cell division protease FtsH